MEKSGAAPPYEANPSAQYGQPPMHQQPISPDSYNQHNQQVISAASPMASPGTAVKQEYYASQQQQQPQQPQQQVAHPQTYNTATPLASLQDSPAPVDCPICHTRAMTRVEAESGNTTHAWAAVICFCCCLGCIPYLIRSLKDSNHRCGHCGAILATFHSSGRTVVKAHA